MELLLSAAVGEFTENAPRSRWLLVHAAMIFAFLYLPIAVPFFILLMEKAWADFRRIISLSRGIRRCSLMLRYGSRW
jgi:hypothetical protein